MKTYLFAGAILLGFGSMDCIRAQGIDSVAQADQRVEAEQAIRRAEQQRQEIAAQILLIYQTVARICAESRARHEPLPAGCEGR